MEIEKRGYARPEALVGTDWLEAHLQDPKVRVLDGTFFLPVQNRNAREEYHDCRIPGAGLFDVDEVCDPNTTLPHMLPSPELFADMVGAMGIDNDTHVVAYDASGITSAAVRVWWMFRIFGHDNVSVLDGGFPKWLREGRPVEEEAPPPVCEKRLFKPSFRPHLVTDIKAMRKNLESRASQVVDARPLGRFKGEAPEPRTVLKQGHIPGSRPLPFPLFAEKREGTLPEAKQLKALFDEAGVDLSGSVISLCGSGVTACLPALAAFVLGFENVSIYDGSWAEWGNVEDTPAELG